MVPNLKTRPQKNNAFFKSVLLFVVVSLCSSNFLHAQVWWSTTGNLSTSPTNYIGTAGGDKNPVLIKTGGILMASFGLTNNISFQNSTASNSFSVAMGYGNIASGYATTAMGNVDTATGYAATAMGENSRAGGDIATAIGENARAMGGQSIATGNGTNAMGWSSTAMGWGTIANGDVSTAIGQGTFSSSRYEMVVGSFNKKYTPLGGVAGYNAADRIFSIGIGTADNARSNALTVLKNGKVGLGTTTPTEILDVTGNVKFSGALMPNNTAGTAGQVLTSAGPGASPTWAVANASSFNGTNNYVAKFTPTGSAIGNSEIYDNGTFVGIGTTTAPAGYSLAVNGKIIATKLVVQLYGNWPDYVFQNNYKLTPIADLEKYIDQNQHLPGVPSACDIEKSGIDVGANQQILLQKVEELTLYIIDQNKKIEDQDKKIGQLQTQDDEIQQLKKEVDDLKMLLQKSK